MAEETGCRANGFSPSVVRSSRIRILELANKRTANSLRSFHRLGRAVCKADCDSVDSITGRRASGSFSQFCDQTGRSRNESAKARKFAKQYNPEQLKTICSLGRKAGRPLTKTHVSRLVVVSNGTLRNKLARECADQCWTVQRLEYEIQRIQPKRAYGGRELNSPQAVDDALVETLRMANRWIRWTEMLAKADRRNEEVSLRELPAGMRERQIAITAEMKRLQRQILKLMKPPTRTRRRGSRRGRGI
jgi:hypothetical protein